MRDRSLVAEMFPVSEAMDDVLCLHLSRSNPFTTNNTVIGLYKRLHFNLD